MGCTLVGHDLIGDYPAVDIFRQEESIIGHQRNNKLYNLILLSIEAEYMSGMRGI